MGMIKSFWLIESKTPAIIVFGFLCIHLPKHERGVHDRARQREPGVHRLQVRGASCECAHIVDVACCIEASSVIEEQRHDDLSCCRDVGKQVGCMNACSIHISLRIDALHRRKHIVGNGFECRTKFAVGSGLNVCVAYASGDDVRLAYESVLIINYN